MDEALGREGRSSPEPSSGAAGGDGARARAIADQFEVALGCPDAVTAALAGILAGTGTLPTGREKTLLGLAPLLRRRTGAVAAALFDGLSSALDRLPDPRPLLLELLRTRDPELLSRALAHTERLVAAKAVHPDRRLLAFFAERFEERGGLWERPETLNRVAELVESSGPSPPWTDLLTDPADPGSARLAARALDRHGEPAPPGVARRILGEVAYAFLAPYLAYTRAGHADLLALVPRPGAPPPALAALRRAAERCGESALRDIVARLGWPAVNLGLEAGPVWEVSLAGAFPYLMSPEEAPLLEAVGETRKHGEAILAVAHGGAPDPGREGPGAEDPVARFRAMNLVHAELLAEILDVSPLTPEKVRRILGGMDRIVADFVGVFARHAEDEAAALPGLYAALKGRVEAELTPESRPAQLSAELTRLVQAFEDPQSLAEVRTLHGLKRYLHQRGLRLGFRLVEAGRATNRSVRVLVLRPRREPPSPVVLRYVDFEPGDYAPDSAPPVPYPVRALAEGISRQLLVGTLEFPDVKIFCYGNEVHYYLAFGTHPAFLRVDYAPPLRGGMVDLEYYGVSKVDLGAHPDPSLAGIRLLLERLDFDVTIDATRVHARYDKERALDLGELCEHAEALLRLLPHVMDVDWTIGSLRLSPAARCATAEAWAEFFLRWGSLPVERFLTDDRVGITTGRETGPAGDRETVWDGRGPYRDRYRPAPAARDFLPLVESLGAGGRAIAAELESAGGEPMGQLALERLVLRPLHEAAGEPSAGATHSGRRPGGPPPHEAERFAHILEGGVEPVAAAARAAALVAPLTRSLRFRTTGSVEGFATQHAVVPLRGARLDAHVLRDPSGLIRLAYFTGVGRDGRRRLGGVGWPGEAGPEEGTAITGEGTGAGDPGLDAARLAALLRRNSYPVVETGGSDSEVEAEARETLAAVGRSAHLPRPRPIPGERLVTGLRASPGRAVGRAVLDAAGRTPESLRGAVLVAASVRPEDTVFLFHAAGVVSTGGGILSHAGLTAVQFRKPALVISGRWEMRPDGVRVLWYRVTSWRPEIRTVAGFEIEMRRDLRESEHALAEGDLVVVDAESGRLRVLGQDREVLALTEDLAELGEAHRLLAGARDEREILALRGRRLRARHQLLKLLGRLHDPIPARHAVEEILSGVSLATGAGAREEKGPLLIALLANPFTGGAARDALLALTRGLARRVAVRAAEAVRRLPTADTLFEILAQRLGLVRVQSALEEATAALTACGLPPESAEPAFDLAAFDVGARERLLAIRSEQLRAVTGSDAGGPRLRHHLRRLRRLDAVLDVPEADRRDVTALDRALARRDRAVRTGCQGRQVLLPAECGFEMNPLIGWKAANLAEVERLIGPDRVPRWFVVTHGSFAEMLRNPLPRGEPTSEGPRWRSGRRSAWCWNGPISPRGRSPSASTICGRRRPCRRSWCGR